MMISAAEHSNGVTDYQEGLMEPDDTALAASEDDKAPSLFADPGALLRTVVSGGGFLADAYDLFVVNLVIVVLTFDQSVSAGDKSLIATAVLVGSILGQLSFGYIADVSGRRIAFIITVALLIVGSTLSALAVPIGAVSLFLVLAAARFVLGVGVGGEYPLSATVSSEATTNIRGRGARVAAVFSMQGVGALLAPCVVLTLVLVFPPGSTGLIWRFALGFGAVPPAAIAYFRWKMKETAAYKRAVAAAPVRTLMSQLRLLYRHRWTLTGTAGSWFIFDVVFYANSLFSGTVLQSFLSAAPKSGSADYDQHVRAFLITTAMYTVLLACCALPGYYTAVALIDVIGRRNIQLIGFFGMAVAYIVCGLTYEAAKSSIALFFVVYGVSFFFSNFGPNATTFVLAAESFPTSIRATAHGTSAAVGKAGATVGAALMPIMLSSTDLPTVCYISALIALSGLAFTYVFTKETLNVDADKDDVAEQSAVNS